MKPDKLYILTGLMGEAYKETIKRMTVLTKKKQTPEVVLRYYTECLTNKLKELQDL